MNNRELTAQAKADGRSLFSITVDDRPTGGGKITFSGIARPEDRDDITAVIRRIMAREIAAETQP